jgi:hypothetical protein
LLLSFDCCYLISIYGWDPLINYEPKWNKARIGFQCTRMRLCSPGSPEFV